jgi:UDP-N-acetyl-2-amino-2-deoxyglucuronate dehydrogenase
MNFALIGAAGFIAPRHLQAIKQTGNTLIAAVDPHDSVGVLDNYFPTTRYFTEIERFDRHLEKLRRGPDAGRVDYVSICTPNYLHDAHVRLALRAKAHAICEKPLVINSRNLDQLMEIEAESETRVYTVLQLRHHPSIIALRKRLADQRTRADVCLTYITRRGPWYQVSWKGAQEKSGGLVMNIGVHFFDLFLWLFGSVERNTLFLDTPERASGTLEFKRARVRWYLSIAREDLPGDGNAYRSITVDDEETEFSNGFGDLHTKVYEDILAGRGHGIEDARPSIELLARIRASTIDDGRSSSPRHPLLGES